MGSTGAALMALRPWGTVGVSLSKEPLNSAVQIYLSGRLTIARTPRFESTLWNVHEIPIFLLRHGASPLASSPMLGLRLDKDEW